MSYFKTTGNAQAKIENRYTTLAALFTLLVLAGIAETTFRLVIHPVPGESPYFKLLIAFFLYANILNYVLWVQPRKFNHIIQSIEVNEHSIKIVTFPFKLFLYNRKPMVVEVDKSNVVYRKQTLDLSTIINNLPFAKSYALKYNNNNYYLVPSLFNHNDNVMGTVIINA